MKNTGSLIKCTKSNKMFIEYLDSKSKEKFIICDLDETHLVIKDEYVEEIKKQIYAMQDENCEDRILAK